MEHLFPLSVSAAEIPAIPGLSYLSEYISASEEQKLVKAIDALPWDTSWQRRRQIYGSSYGSKELACPIPPWWRELAKRLFDDKVTAEPFDQMLVNEYAPGQGIALHRDYEPFGRTVCSLSLFSPCVMNFRHVESGHKERLLLTRRSLLRRGPLRLGAWHRSPQERSLAWPFNHTRASSVDYVQNTKNCWASSGRSDASGHCDDLLIQVLA